MPTRNSREPVANPAPAPFTIMLLGQMQSGKNRILITRTGHRYPPTRFVAWREDMIRQLEAHTCNAPLPLFDKSRPVCLIVYYWPGDKIRRDAPGMLDALCHCLERAHLIEDDAQIKAVDWQELELDRTNPRITVSLRQLATTKLPPMKRPVEIGVDMTPTPDLAIRILQAFRDDCDCVWADNTGGEETIDPLLIAMNQDQQLRAAELDAAIHTLQELRPISRRREQ